MEKFKEIGFTICAIAIGITNLFTFVIIAVKNISYIYEPNPWILYLEMALDLGFIIWGFERLAKDIK